MSGISNPPADLGVSEKVPALLAVNKFRLLLTLPTASSTENLRKLNFAPSVDVG